MSVVDNVLRRIEEMGYIVDSSVYKLRLDNLLLFYVLLENEKIDVKIVDYDIAKKMINRFVRELSYMHFLFDLMRRSGYRKTDIDEAMNYLYRVIKYIKDDLFWVDDLKESCNKVLNFILKYELPGALIDGNNEFIRKVSKFFVNVSILCKRIEKIKKQYG